MALIPSRKSGFFFPEHAASLVSRAELTSKFPHIELYLRHICSALLHRYACVAYSKMHILTLNFALQRPQPAQAPRPSLRISPILLLHSCQLHFPFTPAPRDSAQSQPRVLSIAISSSCCCLCTRRTAGYISTCGCAYDARATWVGLRTSGRRIRRYRGRISFPFSMSRFRQLVSRFR